MWRPSNGTADILLALKGRLSPRTFIPNWRRFDGGHPTGLSVVVVCETTQGRTKQQAANGEGREKLAHIDVTATETTAVGHYVWEVSTVESRDDSGARYQVSPS